MRGMGRWRTRRRRTCTRAMMKRSFFQAALWGVLRAMEYVVFCVLNRADIFLRYPLMDPRICRPGALLLLPLPLPQLPPRCQRKPELQRSRELSCQWRFEILQTR